MKTNWTKLPSVTRPGRFFYRASIDGTVVTVLQSWLTHLWHFQKDKEPQTGVGGFVTAQEAMQSAELNGV